MRINSSQGAANPSPVSRSTKGSTDKPLSTSKDFPPKKKAEKVPDLMQKIRQKMALTTPPYTLAEVYRGADEWYVHFSYRSPITGKFERFKESYGLNKKRNLPIRESLAMDMVSVINDELKKGFNPFTPIRQVRLKPAIEHLEEIVKNWKETESPSIHATYQLMKNRFKKFIDKSRLSNITVEVIDIAIATNFQRYLMEELKLAPKTVNATISHLGSLFDELIRRQLAQLNPFRSVKHITRKSYKGIDIDLDSEENDFIPLTPDETEKIFKHLAEKNRELLRFYGLVYWCFIRPVEISRLKVEDVDLNSGLIRIRKGDAKNKSSAYVQILTPVKKLLMEMDLQQFPPDFYLFTGPELLPGPKQRLAKTSLRKWNAIVHSELKIYKKPYSLKHTGNIHYIVNNKGNVDREWLKMQNRHKTRAQTDTYIERLNIYLIDENKYNFTQLPNSVTEK